MKQVLPLALFLLCISYSSFSQSVGAGTVVPDSSAQLDITNTNKGILIPRMRISAIVAIPKPAKGLMVYDSVSNQMMVNTGTAAAPNWQTIVANSGWNLMGNIGTKTLNQFVGTNDNAPLRFRINNQWAGQVDSASRSVSLGMGASVNNASTAFGNVAIGNAALNRNIKGNFTTAIGDSAGYSIDSFSEAVFLGNKAGRGRISNSGGFSVLVGSHAGDSVVSGSSTLIGNYAGIRNATAGNVMIGSEAGRNNTTGIVTLIGDNAGWSNTTGTNNVFIGTRAADSSKLSSGTTTIGYESMMLNNANEAVFIGNLAGKGILTSKGDSSTIIGSHAGDSVTASRSTIIGNFAGRVNQASGNTIIGSDAGQRNTTGVVTLLGDNAGLFNTTGTQNTALGTRTLQQTVTGSNNTAVGYESSRLNRASFNTAVGVWSLVSDSAGQGNTAIGTFSQFWNLSNDNTAVGYESLNQNNLGFQNSAVGTAALWFNLSGNNNTAVGDSALFNSFGGQSSFNTAIGARALQHTTNSQFNVAIGYKAGSNFDMGFNNTIIGANSDVTGNGIFNSVALGEATLITASNQVRVGNSSTNSIGGFASWTNISDGRFKKNIQEDVKGIEFIMKLRPVTYQLDIDGINNKFAGRTGAASNALMKASNDARAREVISGFVAQEVEQAAKESGYEFSGVDKPKNQNDFYGLRYSDFVVPLVKAMQELEKKNQLLKDINNNKRSQIEELLKRLEKLEAANKK